MLISQLTGTYRSVQRVQNDTHVSQEASVQLVLVWQVMCSAYIGDNCTVTSLQRHAGRHAAHDHYVRDVSVITHVVLTFYKNEKFHSF